ncbi:alpha/beta fold hydrolase [Eubacterium barkeri]|uniref:Alpha/beta hydrolase family protein n=1 Tax=Eubacterium barkeri TaxID=1528 RepID=A0A1H3ET45_EUBBA|nr:alpha/beta fold hydrolase [Eubacterium barkeri]SDX81737.1 Alpha/beta hydrolase family protein [Eubacterium barkeri]
MEAQFKKHRRLKGLGLGLAIFLALCILGFYAYTSDYYHADATARAVMTTDSTIEVADDLTILHPEHPNGTGLIFYPGAKVEAKAYLPLLEKLKDQGITCVLVKMPYNMAIFNPNAADGVYAAVPEISRWYIGGHSMGGAMASSYAAGHPQDVEGLILLGAYIYGDYPPEKTLTVYGSFNANLEKNINYTENIVVIEGGNHAQFGNYGAQKGDPPATISPEEQQNAAVAAMVDFMKEK